jgi:hypothetical protein
MRSSASTNSLDYRDFVNGLDIGDLTNNGNNDPTAINYAQTSTTRNWADSGLGTFRWGITGG